MSIKYIHKNKDNKWVISTTKDGKASKIVETSEEAITIAGSMRTTDAIIIDRQKSKNSSSHFDNNKIIDDLIRKSDISVSTLQTQKHDKQNNKSQLIPITKPKVRKVVSKKDKKIISKIPKKKVKKRATKKRMKRKAAGNVELKVKKIIKEKKVKRMFASKKDLNLKDGLPTIERKINQGNELALFIANNCKIANINYEDYALNMKYGIWEKFFQSNFSRMWLGVEYDKFTKTFQVIDQIQFHERLVAISNGAKESWITYSSVDKKTSRMETIKLLNKRNKFSASSKRNAARRASLSRTQNTSVANFEKNPQILQPQTTYAPIVAPIQKNLSQTQNIKSKSTKSIYPTQKVKKLSRRERRLKAKKLKKQAKLALKARKKRAKDKYKKNKNNVEKTKTISTKTTSLEKSPKEIIKKNRNSFLSFLIVLSFLFLISIIFVLAWYLM